MNRTHAAFLTVVTAGMVAATSALAGVDGVTAGPAELVSGGFRFTEGPAHHPDGYLLFSDIPNNRVHKLDYETGDITVWCDASDGNNGIVCTQDGVVYGCQKSPAKLARFTADGRPQPVVSQFDGRTLNSVNDLTIDSYGGVYFTDPVYGGPQPQPVQGVYYQPADGPLRRVVDDVPRPNGVNISADGRTLYVADANNGRILAYDVTGPGTLSGRRVFYDGDESLDGGGPDGMCLDADGRLYATMNQVVVLSPEGELLGRIAVDEKPANCSFGGPGNQTLYVTARTGLYAVPMAVTGAALPANGPPAAESKAAAAVAGPKRYFVMQKSTDAPQSSEDEGDTNEVVLRDLTLNLPSGWKTGSGSRMRLGTYVVPPAGEDSLEVQYVVFPPMGGTVKANIDRWVNQFAPAGRDASATTGKAGDLTYVLADITGTYNMSVGPPMMGKTQAVPDARMLAAVITVPSGGNYFIKMAGPKATVDSAAAAFRKSFGADAASETDYPLD